MTNEEFEWEQQDKADAYMEYLMEKQRYYEDLERGEEDGE